MSEKVTVVMPEAAIVPLTRPAFSGAVPPIIIGFTDNKDTALEYVADAGPATLFSLGTVNKLVK
jgi:hypothetical protein